uniref:PAT complex subunit Asterix n=1 Tax=Podarcis muralis TaxID=64176 RepID=A0A670HNK9_PODMU
MAHNNIMDQRHPKGILRSKSPSTENNPVPLYRNLPGMVFGPCGSMLKPKWPAWIDDYCPFISFSNSRSSEQWRTKQVMSSFMSISALVMPYLQNPQPVSCPW